MQSAAFDANCKQLQGVISLAQVKSHVQALLNFLVHVLSSTDLFQIIHPGWVSYSYSTPGEVLDWISDHLGVVLVQITKVLFVVVLDQLGMKKTRIGKAHT